MIKSSIFSISFLIFQQIISAQVNLDIEKINNELRQIEEKRCITWTTRIFYVKEDIKEVSQTIIPNDNEIIKHNALIISYNEDHEQANWVAHKINKKIIDGNVSRTNNFRVDTLITTGSSEEKDYFLKSKLPSGKYTYDGYGYDEGTLLHLQILNGQKQLCLNLIIILTCLPNYLNSTEKVGWSKGF